MWVAGFDVESVLRTAVVSNVNTHLKTNKKFLEVFAWQIYKSWSRLASWCEGLVFFYFCTFAALSSVCSGIDKNSINVLSICVLFQFDFVA